MKRVTWIALLVGLGAIMAASGALMGGRVWGADGPADAQPGEKSPMRGTSGPSLSISPAELTILPHQQATVRIAIDGATDVSAFETEMTYDPQIVRVTDVRLGSFLATETTNGMVLGPVTDNGAGAVKLGGVKIPVSPGREGSGILAEIDIRAEGLGSTDLILLQADTKVLNPEAAEGGFSTESGEVTVSGGFALFLPIVR